MTEILIILLGFAVGALGTLIGAGGGFVLMPVLLICYPGADPERLTAISLAAVFCNATSGSITYGFMKRIDYKSGLLFLITGLPAAALGAYVVKWVPRQAFNMTFGLLLVAACVFILVKPAGRARGLKKPLWCFGRKITDCDGNCHEYAYNLPLGMALCFLVGVLATLLGIGGGIIHVPVMAYVLNFPVHLATATSHFILAAMALVGTVVHLFNGSLEGEFLKTGLIAVGVVAGAQLGARLSNKVKNVWIMRCLAVALGFVGIRVLLMALWK